MSGLVRRCESCGAEVIVRRRHKGKAVPCPGCGKSCEVPKNVDFLVLDAATEVDRWNLENCAGFLALSLPLCCLFPVPAGVWWWCSAAIRRAREEDRVVLPALLRLRRAAIAMLVFELAFWVLMVETRL